MRFLATHIWVQYKQSEKAGKILYRLFLFFPINRAMEKKTTCLKKERASSLNSQKVSRDTFLDSRKSEWGCSGILSG
jgi:hypothetical protein